MFELSRRAGDHLGAGALRFRGEGFERLLKQRLFLGGVVQAELGDVIGLSLEDFSSVVTAFLCSGVKTLLRVTDGLDEDEEHREACKGSEHPREGGTGFFRWIWLRHGETGIS